MAQPLKPVHSTGEGGKRVKKGQWLLKDLGPEVTHVTYTQELVPRPLLGARRLGNAALGWVPTSQRHLCTVEEGVGVLGRCHLATPMGPSLAF